MGILCVFAFAKHFKLLGLVSNADSCPNFFPGKQRRLKQAKEEAQEEIERYRQERERQFKEFEAKVSKSQFRTLLIRAELESACLTFWSGRVPLP